MSGKTVDIERCHYSVRVVAAAQLTEREVIPPVPFNMVRSLVKGCLTGSQIAFPTLQISSARVYSCRAFVWDRGWVVKWIHVETGIRGEGILMARHDQVPAQRTPFSTQYDIRPDSSLDSGMS